MAGATLRLVEGDGDLRGSPGERVETGGVVLPTSPLAFFPRWALGKWNERLGLEGARSRETGRQG